MVLIGFEFEINKKFVCDVRMWYFFWLLYDCDGYWYIWLKIEIMDKVIIDEWGFLWRFEGNFEFFVGIKIFLVKEVWGVL